MDLSELDEYRKSGWMVRQSGFLLEETKTHILLAGAWSPETEWKDETFSPVTRIPKAWIRCRRLLATVTEAGIIKR